MSLTHINNVPNSLFELNVFKSIFHKENISFSMLYFLSCVFDKILKLIFALHIVKSLVIIDFCVAEKTSQMSLTHKITDVPNSQNTFKTQFL